VISKKTNKADKEKYKKMGMKGRKS